MEKDSCSFSSIEEVHGLHAFLFLSFLSVLLSGFIANHMQFKRHVTNHFGAKHNLNNID